MRRTFIHFDTSTIHSDIINQIDSTNNLLLNIDQNIRAFDFDATAFAHALMLMGQNKNRFGYDLSLYLNTAVYFFRNSRTASGLLVIDSGSSDFKKRMSEDMGVAISSLFMVHSFKLKWETITQIPQNKKISKMTPDFLGFDHNEEKYIYESKGTTQAQKVEQMMEKALAQSKGYPEKSIGKFAIVSYFPTSNKLIPAFTFVADPPISDFFQPNYYNSVLLHYKYVFKYIGLSNTAQLYNSFLVEKFRLERQAPENNAFRIIPSTIGTERLIRQVRESFAQERLESSVVLWRGEEYIGRYLDVPDLNHRPYMGCNSEIIEQIVNLEQNISSNENAQVIEGDESISTFSDGTMLKISGFEFNIKSKLSK